MDSISDLAVTTPTGNVGRHVLRGLVRAGLRPRALVRDPSSLSALGAHVDPQAVDLDDPDALAEGLSGCDAAYLVVPAPRTPDPVAAYAELGARFARAAGRAGVRRVVLQSSVGAELRHGAGEIDGLARVEEILDDAVATGTIESVVHLRCGYFFTNLLLMVDDLRSGSLSVLLPLDQPMPWVAPRDIAEVAVGRLLAPAPPGRHVQAVHGPADLSWAEVAEVLTALLDHEVSVRRIDDDAMRAGLREVGMTDHQVEALVGMSTGLRDGFRPEQPRDATTTTPTTLGAWVVEELRPALR